VCLAAKLTRLRNISRTGGEHGRTASGLDGDEACGRTGAEVQGLDIDSVLESDIATIESLLLEHMVLFFPRQSPKVDAHVAFGRHFGKLEGNPNLKNAFLDCPEILELTSEQGGLADEWHTDIPFHDNPSLMSVLHMVECPARLAGTPCGAVLVAPVSFPFMATQNFSLLACR